MHVEHGLPIVQVQLQLQLLVLVLMLVLRARRGAGSSGREPGRGGDGARAPRFTALPARAQAGTTSYWSHIGGFLTGTAMALLILPRPANARYVPLPVRALIVTAACGACLRTRAVTPPLPPPPSPV